MFIVAGICWFFFSLLVALLGSRRNIGGFVAFLISILLSPIIGLLFVAVSSKPVGPVVVHQNAPVVDRTGELERLARLKESGAITEGEFEAEKRRVMQHPAPHTTAHRPVDTTSAAYGIGRLVGRYGRYILIAAAVAVVIAIALR